MKHESRNPKSETNPNFEFSALVLVSDFDIRILDLPTTGGVYV